MKSVTITLTPGEIKVLSRALEEAAGMSDTRAAFVNGSSATSRALNSAERKLRKAIQPCITIPRKIQAG